MERLKITPEDAFELLRRASQQLNIKLREVTQASPKPVGLRRRTATLRNDFIDD